MKSDGDEANAGNDAGNNNGGSNVGNNSAPGSGNQPAATAQGPSSSQVAAAAAAPKQFTINVATVTAKSLQAAKEAKATTVTLGPKVRKVRSGAFKGTSVRTVIVKTKKLKAASVKGCFKQSKIKRVTVKTKDAKNLKGKKLKKARALNRSYVKAYAKIFKKKNCGAKVSVKA